MKGKYKREKHWCTTCDKDIAEGGKKCKTCGKREYGRKMKKPSTKQILNDL